jgi:hypothetical protein
MIITLSRLTPTAMPSDEPLLKPPDCGAAESAVGSGRLDV